MVKMWLELMATLGHAIYRQKFYLRLGATAIRRTLASCNIVILEIVLAIVSLPFYIFIDHTKFPDFFCREGHSYTLFKKRKKTSLIAAPTILAIFGVYMSLAGTASASVFNWNGAGTGEACPSGENNWSCPANWVGGVVPSGTDIAVFDGTSSKNVTLDVDVIISGLEINSGYVGIITQLASVTINGNYSQSSGIFNGGSNTVDINGNFTVGSGEFFAPTGDMSIEGAVTLNTGAVFNHNNGTLIFDGATDTSIHSLNELALIVNNLTINKAPPSNSFVVSGAPSFGLVTVLGTLNLTSGNLKYAGESVGVIESRGMVNFVSSNFGSVSRWKIGGTDGVSVFVGSPTALTSSAADASSVSSAASPVIKNSKNRQINIQVRFKRQTEFGEYNDALNFTADEYSRMDVAALESMEKERVDKWTNLQKNPPPPVEPTEEQLMEEKEAVEEHLEQIKDQIEEVTN